MTVMPRSSRRAIAVGMRDPHGSLVDDTVCMVAVSLATQGEALAVRLACLMDSSLNQTMVEIEGDNKQLQSESIVEDLSSSASIGRLIALV
ncbi:hypothetical protein LOK49_LG01G03753 [Camellia lanceoleosa]|uniref:Uncharacterized protein n=1 Tax=Camellia lanceoleosa TaxID=1840588 RepID=A0ACC0IUL5_9ERIC|nr:hypothetical protein LOK49_LG01G03753 [Camellia lanceoleosa]